MAISPVDLFRPQPLDGIGQILAGGTNVLGQAVSAAVQIGRDGANLRATQEREYLAERERVENLDQRRGEFLTRNLQIDRAFFEDKSRDRRDFSENQFRDTRDFGYKVDKNAQEAGFELKRILQGDERIQLEKDRFDLEKQRSGEVKPLLRQRATDIVEKTQKPGLIAKMFGASDPLPEDDVNLGKELKEIGVTLRDPAIISRGDELLSRGTKGVIDRREKIRQTPLPPRPSSKKVVAPEERLVEVEREIAAMSNPNVQLDKDLTQTARIKLNELMLEKEDLLKRIKGGTVIAPSISPAKTAAEGYRDLILKKK